MTKKEKLKELNIVLENLKRSLEWNFTDLNTILSETRELNEQVFNLVNIIIASEDN